MMETFHGSKFQSAISASHLSTPNSPPLPPARPSFNPLSARLTSQWVHRGFGQHRHRVSIRYQRVSPLNLPRPLHHTRLNYVSIRYQRVSPLNIQMGHHHQQSPVVSIRYQRVSLLNGNEARIARIHANVSIRYQRVSPLNPCLEVVGGRRTRVSIRYQRVSPLNWGQKSPSRTRRISFNPLSARLTSQPLEAAA